MRPHEEVGAVQVVASRRVAPAFVRSIDTSAIGEVVRPFVGSSDRLPPSAPRRSCSAPAAEIGTLRQSVMDGRTDGAGRPNSFFSLSGVGTDNAHVRRWLITRAFVPDLPPKSDADMLADAADAAIRT